MSLAQNLGEHVSTHTRVMCDTTNGCLLVKSGFKGSTLLRSNVSRVS